MPKESKQTINNIAEIFRRIGMLTKYTPVYDADGKLIAMSIVYTGKPARYIEFFPDDSTQSEDDENE